MKILAFPRGAPITLLMVTILVAPVVSHAALPFTIKAGQHPRVLIDPARISAIQADALAAFPLYGAKFPQSRGTLSFDLYPTVRTDANQSELLGIFDNYSGDRNHLFLRHYDSVNTGTGLTYCGTDPADTSKVCLQLALQPSLAGKYIAAKNFSLNAGQWQTVRISWNAITHTAKYQIAGNNSVSLAWGKDANNLPVNWQPDGQHFVFSGRDRLDNVRVYDNEIPAAGTLLADFPMNDASGIKVTDVSGMNVPAQIRGGVSWDVRSTTDPDPVIKMDGNTGAFGTASGSVLYYAWVDYYKYAKSIASQINSGTFALDIATAHPNAILNVSRQLGLSYLVTGESQFLTAALAYADQLIAVMPGDSGGDYTQAGRIEAMGILYDWFFTEMTSTIHAGSGLTYGEALVAAIKGTLLPLNNFICGAGNALTSNWDCSSLPANPDAVGSHAHQNNTEITAALLAIIDEHPELEPLLKVEYDNFTNLFNPAREWISIDGGHHMGWAYGSAYTFLDSIRLWDTATTDVNMKAAWQGKLINRYIYGLRGDMRFPASGDAFPYAPWNEQLVDFALWGSREFGNTYGQNFYNRIILPGKTGSRFYELLDWQANLPETAIENLPYSRFFRNSGQVLMRNSWDYPNATLLEFKSTSFQSINHHHLDQNAFTLFYKSPLLVDSGDYDKYGTEHWHNYYTRTIAHNTVTILDPAESFIRKWNFTFFCCSNDGGQQFPVKNYPDLADIQPGGSNHLDGITAYEYTPEYTYTRGNASKAYSAAKLDQNNGFVRHLVFLRNPAFWSYPVSVVFDKVKTVPAKSGLTKRFLLHTVNEPEPLGGQLTSPGHYLMAGNTVTIRNGAGMLFSQTLLPVNPIITKIGGQDASGDYRFLVPVDDGAGGLLDRNFPPSPKPGTNNVDMGAWRIEITAPTPSQQAYFLNVLSVADNLPATQPPSVTNLSSSTAAVANLADTQIIAFNKRDSLTATLQWDAPEFNLPTLVAGIEPTKQYTITAVRHTGSATGYHLVVCQDPVGVLNSSSAGTLSISAAIALSSDIDGDEIGDVCDPDIDGDGLTNSAEVVLGTDPLNPDSDADLLTDGQEVNTYGTDPLKVDSDGDGDTDGDEVRYGSDPNNINDTLNNHRPVTPVVVPATGDTALRDHIFDVQSAFTDPDQPNDYLGASQWMISTDPTFASGMLLDRTLQKRSNTNEVDYRQLLTPNGALTTAGSFFIRTRHRDSVGLWSATWSTPVAFTTVANDPNDLDGDGVDDNYQVSGFVDSNGNGIDDSTEATGIRALYDAQSGSIIGMQPSSGTLGSMTALPNSTIPAGLMPTGNMDYGLFALRVSGLAVNVANPATVSITFYFPSALPAGTTWYRYDPVTASMTDVSANVVFNGRQAVVTLVDGGVGDLDGVVNGVIVDPGGPVFSAGGGGGNNTNGDGAGASSGGGCTLGKNSKFDPLLPLLIVLSFVYLLRRRRRY